jgi:uncharacterized protein (TIGR00369 family)
MPFEPSDPSWDARVRSSFARIPMMATIGAVLDRVAPGEVDVRLSIHDAIAQHHGFVHAGALTTAIDTACGFAALTLMPPGAGVLAIEFKVNLMSPAKGESIVARGRVVKPGRNVTFCHGEVFAVEGGREKLVATMAATMMVVQGRPDVVD